ncbi:MAG: DUF1559 domain-containing protein, partial [Gemmataceae bacterium]
MRRAFTLLELLVVIAILSGLAALLLPAIQKVRERASRTQCANNVRQLALACHMHHDTHSRFPMGLTGSTPQPPRAYMSWLTRITPYLERDDLWNQAEAAYKAEPMSNRPTHYAIKGTVVPAFNCPLDDRVRTPLDVGGLYSRAFTSYLGNSGTDHTTKNGIFYRNSRTKITDIRDGSTNTLLIGERPPSADLWYGWWYSPSGQDGTGSGDTVLGAREMRYLPNMHIPN